MVIPTLSKIIVAKTFVGVARNNFAPIYFGPLYLETNTKCKLIYELRPLFLFINAFSSLSST